MTTYVQYLMKDKRRISKKAERGLLSWIDEIEGDSLSVIVLKGHAKKIEDAKTWGEKRIEIIELLDFLDGVERRKKVENVLFDFREYDVGFVTPDKDTLETCPLCNKPGIVNNDPEYHRVTFHKVRYFPMGFTVLVSCDLDKMETEEHEDSFEFSKQ